MATKPNTVEKPNHLVTFQYLVSEKSQVTGNFYLETVKELEEVAAAWSKTTDRLAAAFKAELEKVEAEVAAKRATAEDLSPSKKGSK